MYIPKVKSFIFTYTVVAFFSYIPPKCAKTREHEDEHCVSRCPYTKDNICDPIPLDNPKNHKALPYITTVNPFL